MGIELVEAPRALPAAEVDAVAFAIAEPGTELPAAAAGLGDSATIDADTIRDAAAAVAREGSAATLAWLLDASLSLPVAEQARAVVDGLVLGGFAPGGWKTSAEPRTQAERLLLVGGDDEALSVARRAEVVAQWTNRARVLANRPPNDLPPE